MSRRTRRLLLLALPALVALTGGGWLFWPRTDITRENAETIQVGMALAEAEAILGGPARDEAGGSLVADSTPAEARGEMAQLFANPGGDIDPFRRPLYASSAATRLRWASDRAVIHVHLGPTGRVVACDSLPVRPEEPLLHRLRRWLGL